MCPWEASPPSQILRTWDSAALDNQVLHVILLFATPASAETCWITRCNMHHHGPPAAAACLHMSTVPILACSLVKVLDKNQLWAAPGSTLWYTACIIMTHLHLHLYPAPCHV